MTGSNAIPPSWQKEAGGFASLSSVWGNFVTQKDTASKKKKKKDWRNSSVQRLWSQSSILKLIEQLNKQTNKQTVSISQLAAFSSSYRQIISSFLTKIMQTYTSLISHYKNTSLSLGKKSLSFLFFISTPTSIHFILKRKK